MENKKIKPVLRLAGSKYRKYELIKKYYICSDKNKFVELFGGTGIISVNIKNDFPNHMVWLNDYDNLFPLTKETVIKNLTTYEGLGKYQIEIAKKYFESRVRNNLWNKVDIYNRIINQIKLTHQDYKTINSIKNSFVFIDPPYLGNEKLYKNTMNHKQLKLYILNLLKNDNVVLITCNADEEILKMYQSISDLKIMYENYVYVGFNPNNKNKREFIITNLNIENY